LNYLVQHTKTREYLHQGWWTLEAADAEVFRDAVAAMVACLQHGLTEVELVLQFGYETGSVCTLPLRVPDRLFHRPMPTGWRQAAANATEPGFATPPASARIQSPVLPYPRPDGRHGEHHDDRPHSP
jgi:hypothetical protein